VLHAHFNRIPEIDKTMKFLPVNCPQCSGPLQIPPDREAVKCMYCGTDINVSETIKNHSVDSRNLKELGDAAAEAGNHEQAYSFYSRILEQEPKNSSVWQKLGTSAGWQSNLVKNRIAEMINCHQKAVINANSEAEKTIIKMLSAQDQLLLAQALFNASVNHVVEFISVPNAKYEHTDRSKEIITLCESSFALHSEDLHAAKFIVDIANRLRKLSSVTADEKKYFNSKVNEYTSFIKQFEPSFNAPSKDAECFVVTATMGDENHPHVITLRNFRDQYLVGTKIGNSFIHWYYENGPHLAKIISNNRLAKMLAHILIVAPSAAIVKVFIRRHS
jgi:tetratricopeptide (TPR) repeat protein